MSDWRDELYGGLELNWDRVRQHEQRMLGEIRAYKLKELRKASGVTQVELAKRLRVSQNRISRLERGEIERMQVDTLQHYIEALGGVLHIEADFSGKRLVVV